MGYITLPQLVIQFGPKELTIIGRPDDSTPGVRVTGLLMRLTVDGGDRSSYTQAERDKADSILDRILDAINRASQLMDSYIQIRHSLPLSPAIILANPLSSICGAIVRFFLSDDFATEETQSRHDLALRWLKDLAAGRAMLIDPNAGIGGALGLGSGGPPGFAEGVRFFDRGERYL